MAQAEPTAPCLRKSGTGEEQHTAAGPGQLQDLGERNLEGVLVLNYRLAGPIPYRGEDLSLLASVYAVPREDGAAALVGTIGALAGFVGAGAAPGIEIANVVKSGVDSILGLGDTQLRLGVNDTFSAGNPLQSGFVSESGRQPPRSTSASSGSTTDTSRSVPPLASPSRTCGTTTS